MSTEGWIWLCIACFTAGTLVPLLFGTVRLALDFRRNGKDRHASAA